MANQPDSGLNMEDTIFSVSDFVGVFNQTLEYAYPTVLIAGELANFRVSKNKWVYFDLKDEFSSVKFFGTVYQLPGPLEDGLMLQVRGVPRLHNQFGFSVNVQSMQPVGEGSLKKAAALLQAKLTAEGLFDPSRKRPIPYPPRRIGLIASSESAAYHDFIKIINARWGGVEIQLYDVQVQGEVAPAQIVAAVDHFNSHASAVDVLVVTRGGGSAEDLAAFSTEQVTRAVAGSRIPTLVAVGHEVDISLAELAADQRASTPSNAAELLVPDRTAETARVAQAQKRLSDMLSAQVSQKQQYLKARVDSLHAQIQYLLQDVSRYLAQRTQLLLALSPEAALKRGYAILTIEQKAVTSITQLRQGQDIQLRLSDGTASATIEEVRGNS